MYFHTIQRIHYLDTEVSKYTQNAIKVSSVPKHKLVAVINIKGI